MVMRLIGVIAQDHDTKLLGEDGEGAIADWWTRPSPKVKPFKEDPGNALTHGRGNRPNCGKDPTLTYGWRKYQIPRRSPMPVNVVGRTDQERCIPILRLMRIGPEVVETLQADSLMAVGM